VADHVQPLRDGGILNREVVDDLAGVGVDVEGAVDAPGERHVVEHHVRAAHDRGGVDASQVGGTADGPVAADEVVRAVKGDAIAIRRDAARRGLAGDGDVARHRQHTAQVDDPADVEDDDAVGARDGIAEGNRGTAGRVWSRIGSKLVILELTTAMVLLVGAGLLGKSFYRLLQVDTGFETSRLITMRLTAPRADYVKDEAALALGRKVQDEIKRLPGVTSVTLADMLPLSFNGNTDWIRFVGRAFNGEHIEVNQRAVTPSYFATLKADLLRGRTFTESEDMSKPRVVVINRTLAEKYFPGEDPIGQRFGDTTLTPSSIKEIIGIVDDIREGPLDSEIWPAYYFSFNQSPDNAFSLAVRTSQVEKPLIPSVTETIRRIDSRITISNPTTMAERAKNSPTVYLRRSSAWLVAGFAAVALLLGVVGLYGVIAYSVTQRTREIGVRIALGAQRGSVYRLILREAGALALAGIVIGTVCAIIAASLMRKLLFGTPPWDIATLICVAGVLGASALLASFLPARRAASVDPISALRAE